MLTLFNKLRNGLRPNAPNECLPTGLTALVPSSGIVPEEQIWQHARTIVQFRIGSLIGTRKPKLVYTSKGLLLWKVHLWRQMPFTGVFADVGALYFNAYSSEEIKTPESHRKFIDRRIFENLDIHREVYDRLCSPRYYQFKNGWPELRTLSHENTYASEIQNDAEYFCSFFIGKNVCAGLPYLRNLNNQSVWEVPLFAQKADNKIAFVGVIHADPILGNVLQDHRTVRGAFGPASDPEIADVFGEPSIPEPEREVPISAREALQIAQHFLRRDCNISSDLQLITRSIPCIYRDIKAPEDPWIWPIRIYNRVSHLLEPHRVGLLAVHASTGEFIPSGECQVGTTDIVHTKDQILANLFPAQRLI